MTTWIDRYLEGTSAPLGGRRFQQIQNVVLLDTVTSTNDVAKSYIEWLVGEGESMLPTVIVAGEQTQGRGRAGHSWTSPGGSSLSLSLVMPWPEGPERIRVPVAMGVSIARGLSRHFGVDVRLKWPNDLMVAKRKVGGILVEARALEDGEGLAVVGVGLNLTSSRAELDALGLQEASSLYLAGVPLASLAGEAPLIAVLEILDAALEEPVEPLPEAFAAVSAHRPGDRLKVANGDRVVEGSYRGITADGMLRLTTASGEETLVSGEVLTF